MKRSAGAFAAALLAAQLLAGSEALALCAPAASGIFPASGIAGTSVTAVVAGESLGGATVTVIGETGLVATVQSANDLAVTLRLDLDAAAVPGERLLILETPAGSTGVSFTVNAAGGPVVADVDPPLLATQGIALDVTVTGSGLAGLSPTSFTVSGAGVTVAAATPSPDGTTLALTFAVDPTADLGTHAVALVAPGGSAVLQLYVQRPTPTITTVSPGAGEVGASVPLTITGANLTGAALVITGSGVTLSDVATPDDATLTATLTIAPGVVPSTEPRLLIVTTESGQTTAEFFVVAAGLPVVTGILPGAGEPGDTVAVTLRGLNFTGGSVGTASLDLMLENPMVVDDETITVDVAIAGGATPGTDHILTVMVGPDTASATFRVIAPGTPFFNAIRPPFGNRGTTITAFLDGVNLATVVPGTGVDLSGPKITESNAAAVGDTMVRVTLEIDPTANVGYRDVTCTTMGGSFMLNAGFRVNVPGQVPSITDVSPRLVQPGTTTPITVTGSNFDGGAVLVTGPGATVTNVVVDASGTVITFDLTLAPDAPAENRAVIVVTENGIARCGIASDAVPPPLVAAKLVKTGALFTVASTAFRLFVFELSLNDRFEPGLRTVSLADADGSLVLSRLDTVNVERAFRSLHRGFVRVRAVTATNRVAVSPAQPIRR